MAAQSSPSSPCLPPTPKAIRNLLPGIAPACAEGSLTQRLPVEPQGTGRGAEPPVCLSPALPGSWGCCPHPGAAPGVLGHIPSPKSSFWCSYSRRGEGCEWGLQTSHGGERGASCKGKQPGLTLWGSVHNLSLLHSVKIVHSFPNSAGIEVLSS